MLAKTGKFFEKFTTEWDRARKRLVEYGGKKLGDDGHIIWDEEGIEYEESCEFEF